MSGQLIQLPHGGDLWRAPQRDDNNELVEPRADTMPAPLARPIPGSTPDQAALLMAENQRLMDELAKSRQPAAGA